MPSNFNYRMCLLAMALWVLGAISVLTIDATAARFDVGRLPGDLRRLVELSEAFAHGTGVAVILITLWVADRQNRLVIPRIAVLAYLSGIVANLCKLIFARYRPQASDLNQSAVESFVGFPGGSSWELQSFPSGHTATAFGLAIGLSYAYPNGRIAFALLAMLAASQRVMFDAHFVSDTLVGAGIAFFVAAFVSDRLFWGLRPAVSA